MSGSPPFGHAGKTSVMTLTICNLAGHVSESERAEDNEGPMMNRTFALLTGAAIALGSLAIAPDANAYGRHFRHYGYYYGAWSGGSPVYAPNRPAPRRYNNPGSPDFQDGSRG